MYIIIRIYTHKLNSCKSAVTFGGHMMYAAACRTRAIPVVAIATLSQTVAISIYMEEW